MSERLALAIGRFFTRHRSLEDAEETGPTELEPGFRASNMKKKEGVPLTTCESEACGPSTGDAFFV